MNPLTHIFVCLFLYLEENSTKKRKDFFMNKKAFLLMLTFAILCLSACGSKTTPVSMVEPTQERAKDGSDFHIAIITESVSQAEDDRRGAEDIQEKYGTDMIKLATYPDNFSEEREATIEIITEFADDPLIKAIIVNEAVPGTAEAFRQVKEKRPDILCFAGEAHDDLQDISSAADLVVNNNFVARGYLMIRNAHELGCDTFVHISFPRHMNREAISRRAAIMQQACDEFGMTFVLETAPDPTTDVGVVGAQQFILEKAPQWIEKYGTNSAFFCTNDAHTEPLIKQLLTYGGYFVEADVPSPLMGYPGALGLDLSDAGGDFETILNTVEEMIVANGGDGRFGTWAYSYGYTSSAGLAEHAINVINEKSSVNDITDIEAAYQLYSPNSEWKASNYSDVEPDIHLDNIILIYQDTYIMGDPGFYLGGTEIEIPEEYYSVK